MFGWTRIATLAAVAAMLAMTTAVAGATSKPGSVSGARSHLTRAGKITGSAATRAALLKAANLRTRAGAARYLRSIGLSASHLVIQRGIRNYAGANCPGKGWSCTSTANPVVQIAAAGGSNTFQCATASCAVVQVAAAGTNQTPGLCIKTTGLNQSCSISQTGGRTQPGGRLREHRQGDGPDADGVGHGLRSLSGRQLRCEYRLRLPEHRRRRPNGQPRKGTPVNVTLNAHQSVSITQDSATGDNTVQNATLTGTAAACDADPAALTQTQTLTSGVTGTASITQNENATDTGPNVTLDITQNQSAGFNGSAYWCQNTVCVHPDQHADRDREHHAGRTGEPDAELAERRAAGHDESVQPRPLDTAPQLRTRRSARTPTPPVLRHGSLRRRRHRKSSPLSQVQYGPIRKGLGDFDPGHFFGDTFTVNQSSTQNNDTGSNQTNTCRATAPRPVPAP